MDELAVLRNAYQDVAPPSPELITRERHRLAEQIGQAEVPPGQPARRWRRVRLLAAGFGAVGVLAAAGWGVVFDHPRSAAAFSCVGEGVVSVLPNDGTSPVDACRRQWAAGQIVPGVRQAPALVACIDRGSSVVVMPAKTATTCQDAGMSVWTAEESYSVAAGVVRDARVELHRRYERNGSSCATPADWRALVVAGFEEQGKAAWELSFDRIEPDRSCFDLASIDPVDQRLTFIGVPGSYSIGCDPRSTC